MGRDGACPVCLVCAIYQEGSGHVESVRRDQRSATTRQVTELAPPDFQMNGTSEEEMELLAEDLCLHFESGEGMWGCHTGRREADVD